MTELELTTGASGDELVQSFDPFAGGGLERRRVHGVDSGRPGGSCQLAGDAKRETAVLAVALSYGRRVGRELCRQRR